MKMAGSNLASLFYDKIRLYQELLDVLDQEKRSIIAIDLDGLWKISDQKKKIAENIAAVRLRMMDLSSKTGMGHDRDTPTFQTSTVLSLVPDGVREQVRKCQVTLVALKDEIRLRLAENKRYVGEYLTVLDELIGVITGAASPKPIYGRRRVPEKAPTHLFLNREV